MSGNLIGRKIKELRKSKGLTQSQLSQLTGYSQNGISNQENGKRKIDEIDINVYAEALGVKPKDFFVDNKNSILAQINEVSSKLEERRQKRVLAYAEHHYSVQQQGDKVIYLQSYKDTKTEEVTVNGYVSAGTGETLVDDIEFIVNYPAGVVPPHDFALQVNGDSMEPLFEHKEIIFVEENTSINSGQLGVFVVDGEAYVKKVFIYQNHIRLVSLNPKYGDMNFYGDSDVRFAGRVIL